MYMSLICFACEVAIAYLIKSVIKGITAMHIGLDTVLTCKVDCEPRIGDQPLWTLYYANLVGHVLAGLITVTVVLTLIIAILIGYFKSMPFAIEYMSQTNFDWLMQRIENSAINIPMSMYNGMLFVFLLGMFKKRKTLKKAFSGYKKAVGMSIVIASFLALFAFFMSKMCEYIFAGCKAGVTCALLFAIANIVFGLAVLIISCVLGLLKKNPVPVQTK